MLTAKTTMHPAEPYQRDRCLTLEVRLDNLIKPDDRPNIPLAETERNAITHRRVCWNRSELPQEDLMDDELITRLKTIGTELEQRSLELELTDQDTALLMQSLAVALDAISSLGKTVSRFDGLEGLGKSGE